MSISIDNSRALSEVDTIRQRAIHAEKFINQKLEMLEVAQPSIKLFMNKIDAVDMKLENMYSTSGFNWEPYTDDCTLKVHGTLTLKKEFKNKILLAKKLTSLWREFGPINIPFASFSDYTIKGTEVRFALYIK